MNKKYFCLNLHMDSLAESYGWPKNYCDDNSFKYGLARIAKIINKFDIPITAFIVGKDLENKKNIYFLEKFINENNVEIANHSYNHLFNLSSKSSSEIYDEIYKSHEIIFKKLKINSKGFCSPAWGFSQNIINKLMELNYNYDCSYFNSLWLYPMIAKLSLNNFLNYKFDKFLKLLNRKDYISVFTHHKEPYFIKKKINFKSKKILEIPMPCLNKFDLPNWHTVGFLFGFKFLKKKINSYLQKNFFFNYIIHPADLLVKRDLDKRYNNSLYRINDNCVESKISCLEEVINIAKVNNFRFIKVNDYYNVLNKKNIINPVA